MPPPTTMATPPTGAAPVAPGTGPTTTVPAPTGPQAPAQGRSGPLIWMATRAAATQLIADPQVRARLAAARLYEIVRPGQEPVGPASVAVWTFTSVSSMSSTLASWTGPLPVKAVMYDPEAWDLTPAGEQRDPDGAMAAAARVAHQHHLLLIAAPALNLAKVLAPPGAGARWETYLRLELAAGAARSADIVEVQAQSLERTPSLYRSFVEQAAAQARRAKPGVTVLAGLSTNPPGSPVTSAEVGQAIEATMALVDGYWVNIPGRGPRCPTCNPMQPSVAIGALRSLV